MAYVLKASYFKTKRKLEKVYSNKTLAAIEVIEAELAALRRCIIEDRTSEKEVSECESGNFNNLLPRLKNIKG